MKIERINENTLKFYISYVDIEDRGFDREEIWYNRDRSEELFWQMMDEAHSQESFSLEGPLWIQVQALEKGMEIIVTRAQVSKNGLNLQLPAPDEKGTDVANTDRGQSGKEPVPDDKNEVMLNAPESSSKVIRQQKKRRKRSFVIAFEDFEDLISLSHIFEHGARIDSDLYTYNQKYFVMVTFANDVPNRLQDDYLSRIMEFGTGTGPTAVLLQEYGKKIIGKHAFSTIKASFPLRK